MRAQRADRSVSHIVQQAKRASRRLNQSAGKRIAQMQIGRRAVALVGGDGVGVLVKTLAAVGHQPFAPERDWP